MGRGSAPQGGPGNYGGSKSAKPRKPKPVTHSVKQSASISEQSQPDLDEEPAAYHIVRPDPQQRQELLQAQRREEVLLARKAAAARQPVKGTAPCGTVLGGVASFEGDAAKLRESRLQHLERQGACEAYGSSCSGRARLPRAEREAVVRAIADLPAIDATLSAARNEQDGARAALLLDMLGSRLAPLELKQSLRLLCTVLDNSIAKEDVKYRQLRAKNDRLWSALLQHPEVCALLEVAGFDQQDDSDCDWAAREALQEAEASRLQVQLQELLESASPLQTTVDSILQRLEELRQSSVRGPSEKAETNREFSFVHPGGEASERVAVVLEVALDVADFKSKSSW
eukprot:TRINITY_DN70225_c0_g1_i1.p1 TRINITY_DN70225_c0_g1~~TRINITY_DN70225_c0_g1_i1.p1  ORF type:complete len:354 (-),score=101.24 TRINITY_DN70225_c0_g1_i1:33-1058(-)